MVTCELRIRLSHVSWAVQVRYPLVASGTDGYHLSAHIAQHFSEAKRKPAMTWAALQDDRPISSEARAALSRSALSMKNQN